MTQTFRHNIDIGNHFNHELYEIEKQLINKENEIAKEIYNIKFGLIYLSFQHHYKIHNSIIFNRLTDNLDTLQKLLQFYINIIMANDENDFYCNTEPLQTNEPTCIQLHESYIRTTDTTLEAELAVHNLKLTPTILTTCELQYSNGALMIPL